MIGQKLGKTGHEPNPALPDGFQMTELGPLPEEWRMVRLEDVVTRAFGGGTPSTSNPDFWGGTIPWTTSAVIQNDDVELCAFQRRITEEGLRNSSTSLAPKGSLLVGTRVGVGKAAVATFDVAISQDLTALILDQHVDAYFVAYLLKSRWYQSWFENNKRGATIKGVPRQDLLKLPIPLPPLPEQRAIAHVLRTVQRAKEATEGVIAALRELKKSLMQHLFTYGPVPVGAKNFSPQQESEIGPLPAHWRVVRLGEVFEIFAGGDISRLNWSPIRKGEFIYPIFSNSLENEGLYGYANTYHFPENSITVTGRGNLGHAVPRNEKFCAIIRLLVLVPKTEVETKFVAEFINGFIKVNLEGSSIPQLTRPKIATYLIPLPPLDEQREIARILQAVDAKIAAEQARRAALEELFKSLLHELMSGQIRLSGDLTVHAEKENL
jgi:type I restriction enzyme S subunit